MGLFDTIRFDFEVPGRGAQHSFQTRSFDNAMEEYLVTKEGKLFLEHYEYVWIENKTLLFGGFSEKVESSRRLIRLTDYHGDVRFYDDCSMCEYTARFSYGRLDNITFKTRERLNDENVLHQCVAAREQDSCPRSQECTQTFAQSGIPTKFICQGQVGDEIHKSVRRTLRAY